MAENYIVTPAEQYASSGDPYAGLLSDVPDVGGWAASHGVQLESPLSFFKSSLEQAQEAHRRQSRVFEARVEAGRYAEGPPEGEAHPYTGSEALNRQLLTYCVTAGLLGLLTYSFLSGRPVFS